MRTDQHDLVTIDHLSAFIHRQTAIRITIMADSQIGFMIKYCLLQTCQDGLNRSLY